MRRLTVKSSTIFISVGDKTRIFRSLEEVPGPLRKQLETSTNGINSATILIADRKGREEIIRALRGMPARTRAGVTARIRSQNHKPPPRVVFFAWVRRHWAQLVLPGALGFAVWLVCAWRAG